ncbi:MAG: patatin-like phospholipase family protein [Bacteroidales bacterium]
MTKKAALVLSSGGARGFAHIGAIRVLRNYGFEISSVAGTSMGALVGGIFAAGRLDVYTHWMATLDKKSMLSLVDFTISPEGIIKGHKVLEEMQAMIPDMNIEDLPIPFTAVATDIHNRSERVFDTGSLYEAIRASISIPGVFTPVKSDGMVLVDGGVVNPLPINRVKRTHGDILIAVDVNGPSPAPRPRTHAPQQAHKNNHELKLLELMRLEKINFLHHKKAEQYNYYQLLTLSVRMMLQRITDLTLQLYPPDLLIRIPMNAFGTYHFYKSTEIISAGEKAALKALKKAGITAPLS